VTTPKKPKYPTLDSLRFTMPERPGTIFKFVRERAPTADELISAYLASIGRLGGKKGGRAVTPAKQAASRENGRKGGRPTKTTPKKLGGDKTV